MHMEYQTLFSLKNKENNIKCLLISIGASTLHPGYEFQQMTFWNIVLISPRKWALVFRANCLLRRQFAWNVKAHFLKKKKTEKYSRLSLSRNPRDSMKHQGTPWNSSRYPDLDISDLQNWGKQLIEQPPLTEWIFNLIPKLETYWKYCWKEEKLLLRSNFSTFPQ